MTIFLIILELIVILLVLSMIYSVAQINQELRGKITDLTQKYLSLDHKVDYLERKLAGMEEKDD